MKLDRNSELDNKKTVSHFTDLVRKYGIDARALDWCSQTSQELRFAILSQVGQLKGANVLDVGCGMGDFFGYLKGGGYNIRYLGVDLTPVVVEIAKKRFPEAQFELGDFQEFRQIDNQSFDFVFGSGLFYQRQYKPFEFLKEIVTRMFKHCKRAVAFNSLSAWADRMESDEFYADPLKTLVFCRTLTPWVSLRHDYHPRDFTVYLYKRE